MLLNFDFDGVIIDSFDTVLTSLIFAQEQIDLGRKPVADDLRKITPLTLEGIAKELGVPGSAYQLFTDSFYFSQDTHQDIILCPSIESVLKELAEQHTLTIISSNNANSVENILDLIGLRRIFSRVLGGENSIPKTQHLRNVLVDFSLPRDKALMIGDAVSDIRAGKQAGVWTAAAGWGFQGHHLLLQAQPDCFLYGPSELLTVVASLTY